MPHASCPMPHAPCRMPYASCLTPHAIFSYICPTMSDTIDLNEILFNSGRAAADMAVEIIEQRPEVFDDVYQLCMKQDGKMAMRAARVVWLVSEEMPELFDPYFADVVERLPDLTHSSVKRCMLKVLSVYDLSDKEDYHGHIIDVCFNKMSDVNEEIAIRGYSIQILDNFTKVYPEIVGELMAALQLMAESGPDTLARYAQNRLKKLYRSAVP